MSQPYAYANRLIPPYTGVLQVVEDEASRAISTDGVHWEIQAWNSVTEQLFTHKTDSAFNKQYFRVARYTLEDGIYRYPLYPTLDPIEVYASCMPVINHIKTLDLPLEINDNYEYWLLDEENKKPLALICSSHKADDYNNIPSIPNWKALSSVQIGLKNTEEEMQQGLTPPSDRLEKMIRNKAGLNPKAYWFKREKNGDATLFSNGEATQQIIEHKHFPEFLFREDWESDEEKSVCHRYLERLSSRLLMLQRLSQSGRARAEVMSKAFPLEVERYYKLYPEIADEEQMVAIRVEARLRRSIYNQTSD